MITASSPILFQIAAVKQAMSAEAFRDVKKAARKNRVSVDSLLWLLIDVYRSGHVRSAAYCDCPPCVIDDGLVTERIGSCLNFTPWQPTQKAKAILEKTT